ncbi:hypothetical protein EVAR_49041_1 [Eumeta japonica]|uniref:Uncharacterized protein n=1 Tax=Eumeta variegata TaxID=151549 RepID=A0A4C1XN41_EUMVA|nr:hypothetical protein EVAR_49041_1 [Eumeta japonica]
MVTRWLSMLSFDQEVLGSILTSIESSIIIEISFCETNIGHDKALAFVEIKKTSRLSRPAELQSCPVPRWQPRVGTGYRRVTRLTFGGKDQREIVLASYSTDINRVRKREGLTLKTFGDTCSPPIMLPPHFAYRANDVFARSRDALEYLSSYKNVTVLLKTLKSRQMSQMLISVYMRDIGYRIIVKEQYRQTTERYVVCGSLSARIELCGPGGFQLPFVFFWSFNPSDTITTCDRVMLRPST